MGRLIDQKRAARGWLANLLMVRSIVMALLAFGTGPLVGASTTVVAAGEYRYDAVSSSRVEHVRQGWSPESSDRVHQRRNIGVDQSSGGSSFAIDSRFATEAAPTRIAGELPPSSLGTADHHLFPQKFRSDFANAGVDIDQFTVTVDHNWTHLRGIHGKGLPAQGMPGRWNQRWADFFEANPNATATDIYQFGGSLMDEFGLSGLPVHPYKG